MVQGEPRGRLAVPRGHADLRDHGCSDGRSWFARCALLGHARCITAERNDPDVLADGCLPFSTLAEANLRPAKRCPPALIWRSLHWGGGEIARVYNVHA